jgi:hypothetical protein
VIGAPAMKLAVEVAAHFACTADRMRIFLLVLVPVAAYAADSDDGTPTPAPHPPDVQRVIDDHDKAVADAKAAYDRAVAKADAAGVRAMDAVIRHHTQDNDLDGAVAAKAIQDGWKPAPAVDTSVMTPDLIAGTYTYTQNGESWQLTINKDGTFDGQKPWEETTWKIKNNMLLIYTNRPTLWTKFQFKDGKLVNTDDLADCDWKNKTTLEPVK